MLGVVAGFIVAFIAISFPCIILDEKSKQKFDWYVVWGALLAITLAAAVVWIGVLGYGALKAETADPSDLASHVVSYEEWSLLRNVETVLSNNSSGTPETRRLDLRDFRDRCTEIRRAKALGVYSHELSEALDHATIMDSLGHLDYREIPVQRDGYLHPFRRIRAIWPDVGTDADGPLVMLADVLLTHDTATLNSFLDAEELALSAEEPTLRERNAYRAMRAAALRAMGHLEQSDMVLDGAPDPLGLCSNAAGIESAAV